MKLKEKAKNYAEALDKVDKKAAINACHLNQLLPSDELEALEKFIVERVNHIVNIISDRVGVPTLGGGA